MEYFPRARTVCGKATVAQINAGLVIVEADPQRTLRVVDSHLRAIGGAATGADAVVIEDTAAAPVAAVTAAVAGLTEGALLRAGAANTTLGAGWNADLTVGKGLQIAKTGAAALATATHVEYAVTFVRS